MNDSTSARRPTIYDVAQYAGLSKSTVSRALRGGSNVSPASQDAIRHAIDALGFIPTQAARTLRTSPKATIGLLTRNIDAPSYAKLNYFLQQRLLSHGMHLVQEGVVGRHPANETALLDNLVGLQVQGVLVATGTIPSDKLLKYAQQVPLVVVGRPEPNPNLHNIAYDQHLHGRLIAQRLHELGHHNVVVQVVPQEYSIGSYARVKAMLQRADELGMSIHTYDVSQPVDYNDLINRTLRGTRATAMSCLYDRYLLTAWRQLTIRGIRVPEDMSLVGTDGVVDGVDLLGLSTIRLPVEFLAERAADLIVELSANPDRPLVRELIPGWLLPGRTAVAVDPATPTIKLGHDGAGLTIVNDSTTALDDVTVLVAGQTHRLHDVLAPGARITLNDVPGDLRGAQVELSYLVVHHRERTHLHTQIEPA